MSKAFSQMTSEEQSAALTETFGMMAGDEYCEIHGQKCVATSDGFGNTFYNCPQCMRERDENDRQRIAKMNVDIEFANWHARTDA